MRREPASPSFYVDGTLYRTVGTPTDLSGTGAPASSFDTIYEFFGVQPYNVATAAPGDPGYNGGRWMVHGLTFADYAAAVATYDTNGSGDFDSEAEVLAALAGGAAVDHGHRQELRVPGDQDPLGRLGRRGVLHGRRAARDPFRRPGLSSMDMPETVLVVDDDATTRDVIVRYLEREGYEALEAEDGGRARAVIERDDPNLVILDLMLPGIDGLSVIRWIRSTGWTPVIMLTALGEETDRIVGLELGADDYVTKPFSPRELVARVKTVLRRSGPTAPAVERLETGDLVLDAAAREVHKHDADIRLTAKEFDLLWFLASHPRASSPATRS